MVDGRDEVEGQIGQRRHGAGRWSRGLLGVAAATVLAAAVHAAVPALSDTMSLVTAMKIRQTLILGLPSDARTASPSITTQSLNCVKAGNVSPMVASYAVAIRKVLTTDEVIRANTFFNSVEGKGYADKLVLAQQANPATTAVVPANLTQAETTALNAFLATSAGQKLLQNKTYVTSELRADLSSHTSALVTRCASGSTTAAAS